jgi:MSHA biogenesis protein MshN
MARWSVIMSVLNQMLRDLERRGAMPDLVAAAGTATVARPALPLQQPADQGRRWIWAGVIAAAAAFVGVHTWLSYRVQDAAKVPGPLGARQFASVVAPPAPAVAAAPALPPSSAPTAAVATTSAAPAAAMQAERRAADVATPAPITAAVMPQGEPAQKRVRGPAAPRASIAAVPPAPSTVEPVVPPVDATAASGVVRATSDVARDVDRAADLIARGRASEAMELLAQVLNRQPAHAGARGSLAALLAEAGRREQALHVLLGGVEVDPGRFAMPAAQLQTEMGDLGGALQTLAKVPLARRNGSFEALHAGVAQRAGDHMTAITAYRRALAQPQPDAVWWVGLGVSLEATGDPAEARNAYARATSDARLPAEIRRYAAERAAVLDAQSQRGEESRRGALANVF